MNADRIPASQLRPGDVLIAKVPGLMPRALIVVTAEPVGPRMHCYILDAPSNIREPEIRDSVFDFPADTRVQRLSRELYR